MFRNFSIAFLAGVMSCTAVYAQPDGSPNAADQIPESEYVTVRDGHLSHRGQRGRYWAVIGKPFVSSDVTPKDTPETRAQKIADARKGTDVKIKRFDMLGFNACRFWQANNEPTQYIKGDGSAADEADYFVYKAKEAGMKIWVAGMNRTGTVLPRDAEKYIAVGQGDPEDLKAWSAAVEEMCKPDPKTKELSGWNLSGNLARAWDPRLEQLAIRRMQNVATHFNQHTGLRWCDDPVFAVWELSNEEWWLRKMVGGGWTKYPAYFRNALVARWNTFLKEKYRNDAGLTAAWKSLLPGESLETASVLLTPMAGESGTNLSINDANAAAQEAVKGLKDKYSRADFDRQRGGDVIEFFLGLQVAHKTRERDAIKPLGRSTRLSPMIFDTGIGYEIQSQYLHSLADAVAHDAYVNGTGPVAPAPRPANFDSLSEDAQLRITLEAERKASNVGRWNNWLLKPPGISQGVPWLEQNKIEGKPYFCYETQIQQPAKYRADFPLRIAALAAIQDWDFICWHYFGPVNDAGTNERAFDKPMDITTGGHPQGYHYTFDAVQNAMMRAAALTFRNGMLKPAPSPTTFIYGRKSLYDPASMDYGGSYGMTGLHMIQTTYQYGVRIAIDPTREDDEVVGPVVKVQDRSTHNPYTPTDQIRFDWKAGYLKWESPASVAFTGLLAKVELPLLFAGDVRLSDVTIANDEGMLDPMGDDEKYVAFALYSTDGSPLATCKAASLSLVSTSFNDGQRLGSEAEGVKPAAGKLPVRYARVAGTITAPALRGMKYSLRDWHDREIGNGKVSDAGEIKVPNDQFVWVVELTR